MSQFPPEIERRVAQCVKVHPLRIPGGWMIESNEIHEYWVAEPDAPSFDCGLSTLFFAVHEHSRFAIDVSWTPLNDPNGAFQIVAIYAPWPRTPAGRRRKGLPLEFDWMNPVYKLTTRSRRDVVEQVENALIHCTMWTKEHD